MDCNKCTTLGSRNKEFEWTYSDNEGISIYRNFKNGLNKVIFTNDEIEKIINFIGIKKEVELANNIEKLCNGTEKEGLGRFIFENIEKSIPKAQAASQLVAIFYKAGILGYNQKSRGMKFWLISREWQKSLMRNLDNTNAI